MQSTSFNTIDSFNGRFELRAILKLAFPILITQLAQVGMGTIDTLMSGNVSTADLTAVAVGTSIWTPIWLFMAGILMALSPIVSSVNASQKTSSLPRLLGSSIWLALMLSIIFGLILILLAIWVVPWRLKQEATALIGQQYLIYIACGLPGAGVFLAYRFYAEALNKAVPITRIMLIGLFLNVPLNALFVYGIGGLFEFGGAGCGIASSLVFAIMALLSHLYTRQHLIDKRASLFKRVRKPHWPSVVSLIQIGTPIGVAIFFEVSLFSVIALFLTELGDATVSGHQVAINTTSLVFMIPLSLAMALTVRVGHYLGANQPSHAHKTAWLGIRINLFVALFNASILIFGSQLIATLYSPDPEVISLAALLLLFAALYQIPDAIQIAAAGSLRGYQDTLVVMMITFFTYWLLGLGSGYWLAFELANPLGAKGFWIGLIIGLSGASILLGARLFIVSRNKITAN